MNPTASPSAPVRVAIATAVRRRLSRPWITLGTATWAVKRMPSSSDARGKSAMDGDPTRIDSSHADAGRIAPGSGDLPPSRRSDPGWLLLRRVLRAHEEPARGRRAPSARDDAGFPEARLGARRDR